MSEGGASHCLWLNQANFLVGSALDNEMADDAGDVADLVDFHVPSRTIVVDVLALGDQLDGLGPFTGADGFSRRVCNLAQRVAELIPAPVVRLDPVRGLDHGAWSVLTAMYAAADIPVVQLSLDTGQPGSFHYALARRLAPLRDEGILVMASGNMVHNLRLFSFHDQRPAPWAAACDATLRGRIQARDHESLMDYDSLGPDSRLAVPTPEHYFPLLYALALQEAAEQASFFNERVVSAISMTSVLIGAPS